MSVLNVDVINSLSLDRPNFPNGICLNGHDCVIGSGPGELIKLDNQGRLPSVDGSQLINVRQWTYSVTLNTSGDSTAYDFSYIPDNIDELELIMFGLNTSGNDNILIQLGTDNTIKTTGYAETMSGIAGNIGGVGSSTGFPIFTNANDRRITGIMKFQRQASTNLWIQTHICSVPIGAFTSVGAGYVSLIGNLNILRITRTGSNAFNAGNAYIRYR